MSDNNETNYMPPKKIAARMIGGTLVAASMAALGPIGTLAVGVTANVLIYQAMKKDIEAQETTKNDAQSQQEETQ